MQAVTVGAAMFIPLMVLVPAPEVLRVGETNNPLVTEAPDVLVEASVNARV